MLLGQDDPPLIPDGQPDPGPEGTLSLGFLAETLLATEELWEQLPEPYRLFGNEFLDAVLSGAGDEH